MRPTKLFLPTLMLLMLMTACSSCAPSNAALRGHSHAAETLDDVAQNAKDTVMELRQAAIDRAVESAVRDNLDPRDAALKAAERFDAGPAIPAVNAFIAAKDAYVRIILSTASKESPSWGEVKPVLRDVVRAYASMRRALGSPQKLPDIPEAVARLLTESSRLDPGEPLAVAA